MRPRVLSLCAALVLSLVAGGVGAGQASAAPLQPDQVVSATPSLTTPFVRNGRVQALALVGSTVVLGGTFTSVSDAGGTALSRPNVAAYDRTTGKLSRTFAPVLNGQVWAAAAGPVPNTVYVAGDFTTVNGVAVSRLALLDVTTGAPVPGFASPGFSSTIRSLVLTNGRLLVGGTFARAGGQARSGLASVNPLTGRLTPFSTAQFTGNHNYGVNGLGNKMPVGVVSMAVTPDGSQLVTIGNFRFVNGALHDQVARFDLSGTTARLREDWTTSWFTAPCYSGSFDSWVRDVEFSPDGSYFVIGSTGGGNDDACDAVLRFETSSAGTDVQPTWLASTGGDSVYTMAVTDDAVYAGGHFRWFNNPLAVDVAGPGAVPRPGLVALAPETGLPLPWNPGRHPRDKGAFAMLATDSELLVGTDTEWVGYRQTRTYRLSRFPLAGGASVPARRTPGLPASLTVLDTAAGAATFSSLDAAGVSATGRSVRLDPVGAARAATVVDGDLYVALADGTLQRRSWDGATVGPATTLTPWDDPYWNQFLTGVNAGETYAGRPSGLGSDLAGANGMFYLSGRLYYARGTSLVARAFEPWNGVSEPTARTVATLPTTPVSVTWADGSLYFSTADGTLYRAPFDGTTLGASTAVGGPAVNGANYAGGQLLVGPGATTCPAATGWSAELFRSLDLTGPAVCRDDAAVDFAWDGGVPAPGVPRENFSARWTRTVDLPAGTYTFLAGADDGIRLSLDGTRVVDSWVDTPYVVRSATVTLPGGPTTISVEYYQRLGGSRVRLDWVRTTSNVATSATATASYTSPWEAQPGVLVDGTTPTSSTPGRTGVAWGTWPNSGTQWVELAWPAPVRLTGAAAYFYDDKGGVPLPNGWKVQSWDGAGWVDAANPTGYPVAGDRFNVVRFAPVTTTRLRYVLDGGTGTRGVGLRQVHAYTG